MRGRDDSVALGKSCEDWLNRPMFPRNTWSRAATAACLTIVACKGDGAGTGTDSTGDTAGSTTVPTTGGQPFDGVRQSVLGTYLPLDGTMVEAGRDAQANGVKLTVESGGTSYPAVYDGAAWMEFAGVPEGVYLLRRESVPNATLPGTKGLIGYTEYSDRELNVGEIFTGRPDKVYAADEATSLSISATGMTAVNLGDTFELYSYNADALDFPFPSFDPEDGSNSPLEGATALSNWLSPWTALSAQSERPLVDFSKGDDLWLTHLPTNLEPIAADPEDPWSMASVQRLTEAAQLTGPPMTDGATTAVAGAFVKVPQKPLTLDFHASAFFDALKPNIPTPEDSGCILSVYLEPGVATPIYGLTPTLTEVYVTGIDVDLDPMCPASDTCDPVACAGGCLSKHVLPGDLKLDLPYGNPFTGGTETVNVNCFVRTKVVHPSAQNIDTLTAQVTLSGRLADLAGAALKPTIGLVQDITIAGKPSTPTDVQTGVGMTPTISFSPPLLGAPDYYTVIVRTIDDVKDANDDVISSRRRIGTVATTNTSVTLPADLLAPGGYYHVVVQARYGLKLNSGGAYQHDIGSSEATSGLFTP